MNWKRKCMMTVLLLTLGAMLCGCVMTVDGMYSLPRRSEGYHNLQTVMDPLMKDLEYAAPVSGRNQQTVQMADLDGIGGEEVILFAKGSDEHPLKIFVFRKENGRYSLMTAVESSGTVFDQVEYVQMDGVPGLEMVVGRKVSDQVPASVCVYRFASGEAEQMMSANYRKYLICDLDQNQLGDLLLLTGAEAEQEYGVAERYVIESDVAVRSGVAKLSRPVDQLKRIMTGKLHGGQNAVFVASAVDADAIVTDVFAMVDGVMTNVSLSSEAGTSVKTLRSYYVYADDIDQDGEMELPSLITMPDGAERSVTGGEHLIRWYSMTPDGGEVDKMYTYHNYLQGWYLELPEEFVRSVYVVPETAGGCVFSIWDEETDTATKLWTVYAFTGEDRSAVAAEDGRFVLLKGDTVVYASRLETAAMERGFSQDILEKAFHLIQLDWYTGEM